MKQCTKCKQAKPFVDFGKRSDSKDGFNYYCKSCNRDASSEWGKDNRDKRNASVKKWSKNNPKKVKAKSKKRYESKKEGHFSIYLLEGTQGEYGKGYVGQTNNLYFRMADHKYIGKIFDRYTVLDIAQTKKEALYLEAQYHIAGYDGASRKQKELRDQIIEENKLKLINK